MSEIKVKKIITHTYETSDGREFDNKKEAMEWQKHLCNIEDMCLLDSEYKSADIFRDSVIYIYAKTIEQANSFNAITNEYFGYGAKLQSTGFFRYDEIADEYVEVENEIEKLQNIIAKLKEGDEECQITRLSLFR